MTTQQLPSGIYVPLITPFTAAGELAGEALEGLAHQALDEGAAGLVALGTTGEPGSLDEHEKRTVLEICARVCREREAPLIVGADGGDTRGGVEALRQLPATAAAALTLVPPFTRPGEAGVLAHFERLAADSPVPLIIYHIPYRTGQLLSTDALRRLAALPGVAGVKYAVGPIGQETVELLDGSLPPGFSVFAADDVVLSPLLALGAHGGMLASAHLCTGRFVELVRAWEEGDVSRARTLGRRLAALSAAAFAEPNPTVVKGALHAQGRIPSPSVRLPLLPAGPERVAHVLEQIAALAG